MPAEMVVAAVPEEMRKSSLVLTSGQVLFPFEDSPHITHDGVILHGQSAPQRAMVNRILHQTECLPSPGCVFFCTGRGAVCAERHKSPCRIRMRSVRK